jgi:hypothetical protein
LPGFQHEICSWPIANSRRNKVESRSMYVPRRYADTVGLVLATTSSLSIRQRSTAPHSNSTRYLSRSLIQCREVSCRNLLGNRKKMDRNNTLQTARRQYPWLLQMALTTKRSVHRLHCPMVCEINGCCSMYSYPCSSNGVYPTYKVGPTVELPTTTFYGHLPLKGWRINLLRSLVGCGDFALLFIHKAVVESLSFDLSFSLLQISSYTEFSQLLLTVVQS